MLHLLLADLALPGIFGVLFHGTWSLLIILDVAIIGLPNDCSQWQLATASILWLLTSFVLTTCLQVWVTAISLRGKCLLQKFRTSCVCSTEECGTHSPVASSSKQYLLLTPAAHMQCSAEL